jgi:hypothetical protein
MDVDALLKIVVAHAEGPDPSPAPADLKARLYSALVQRQAASGPLCALSETRLAGRDLCVFEAVLAAVPVAGLDTKNPCRVCHARVLAEHLERAPIFWAGCPYVGFQR